MPFENGKFSLEELKRLFITNYPHDIPLTWFDEQMNDRFGIDVYAQPFPKYGIATYSNQNVQLLVMRSELSNQTKAEAVVKFLAGGWRDFRIEDSNITAEKNVGETYSNSKTG